MDTATVALLISIASAIATVGLFVVAVVALRRGEKEREKDARLRFLIASDWAARRLMMQMADAVQRPFISLWKQDLATAMRDYVSFRTEATRWKDEPFYASFERVIEEAKVAASSVR